ncbi:hypothetical protein [Gelidibacter algens]|nr:hypothetical protein [Gelidibacter algens]
MGLTQGAISGKCVDLVVSVLIQDEVQNPITCPYLEHKENDKKTPL